MSPLRFPLCSSKQAAEDRCRFRVRTRVQPEPAAALTWTAPPWRRYLESEYGGSPHLRGVEAATYNHRPVPSNSAGTDNGAGGDEAGGRGRGEGFELTSLDVPVMCMGKVMVSTQTLTHTHTRAHTHAQTRARVHTHTNARACACTP